MTRGWKLTAVNTLTGQDLGKWDDLSLQTCPYRAYPWIYPRALRGELGDMNDPFEWVASHARCVLYRLEADRVMADVWHEVRRPMFHRA